MVNEFAALRNRAKTKRDKAIARARAEYASTLVAIATLEQDLAPGPRRRNPRNAEGINPRPDRWRRAGLGRLRGCYRTAKDAGRVIVWRNRHGARPPARRWDRFPRAEGPICNSQAQRAWLASQRRNHQSRNAAKYRTSNRHAVTIAAPLGLGGIEISWARPIPRPAGPGYCIDGPSSLETGRSSA